MSKRWLGLLLLTVWFGAMGVAHAAFVANPDPLDFGPVLLTTSKTAGALVTNDASLMATVTLANGGDCNRFQITSAATFTIGSSPSTVSVQYTPTMNGLNTCTVIVRKQSDGSTLGTFTVSGTGTQLQITVDPTPPALDFLHVDVLTTGGTKTVTVTNTGQADLVITSATVPASHASDYAVTGIAGMQTLAVNDVVHWDIACKPQTRGSVDSTFQIVSNAPTSPSSITLTCTGDEGVISVDTASFDFGATLLGSTKVKTVMLSNPGNVDVTGTTGMFDKTTVGYSIDPLTLVPDPLSPGPPTPVTIRFTPTKASDGGAATLTFRGTWHGHAATPATTTLAGQTVSLSLSTNTIAFGDFRFDKPPQQTFHIINGGSAGIPIQSISLNTDTGTAPAELPFTIKLGAAIVTPPSTLPAGQQFDVTVTATPTNRTGLVGGTFVVHSSLAGLVDQSVVVTGNAIAAGISATAMVDFSAVDIDVAAAVPPKMTAMITNTGLADLDVSAVTIMSSSGTSGAFTFKNPLPLPPTSLAHNASLMLEVTYKPTVERGATDIPDKVVLGSTLTGMFPGPAMQMITIQGHGITRHLAVATPTFPPTFRNPGDAAPVQAVTVQNTGDAVLQITAVMVSGDPVWQLVGAGPVDIPGKSSHPFMVKFSPSDFGPAPAGQLTLMSNDNLNMTKVVTLTGTGVPRDVSFGPGDPTTPVDLGFTGIGIPITAEDVLVVTNKDPGVAFTIHAIQLSGDPGFRVEETPVDVALPAATAKYFAITFDPTAAGNFQTTATLLLDQDHVSTADVKITGHAVFVDAHGSGGCDAGGTGRGGGLVIGLAALAALGRRRRRSAR